MFKFDFDIDDTFTLKSDSDVDDTFMWIRADYVVHVHWCLISCSVYKL